MTGEVDLLDRLAELETEVQALQAELRRRDTVVQSMAVLIDTYLRRGDT